MAREHANIRLDMWGDGDWRDLTMPAQWLYKLLLTHPKTNRAGVCDWRPKRLAAMASGLTAAEVEDMADELSRGFFIVIDEETEEVLVRSYVKHDGVMKQPNMAVTMANDWTGVASDLLRSVIAFEVQKLKSEQPELPGWKSARQLETILSFSGVNVKNDPSVDPSDKGESMGRTTTTATSTTTATPLQEEGGALSAPSIYCSRHPAGTDLPCRGCKVAGAEFEKWVEEQEQDAEPPEHVHRWILGACNTCEAREEDAA